MNTVEYLRRGVVITIRIGGAELRLEGVGMALVFVGCVSTIPVLVAYVISLF